jgi:methyl-accepting chemotaxis protein
VRVALSHKFVVRSLLVAGAAVGFPHVVAAAGIEVAPFASAFVALGVGGVLGFFLSRELGRQFDRLCGVTERIQTGDLRPAPAPASRRFPDETDALACSLAGMLESLRKLVEQVQHAADRLSAGAAELSRSTQHSRTGTEEISTTVETVAKAVAHQQELLEGARRGIHDIAQTIELNAGRAREAFGFSAEANQKAHAGVDVSRLALEKMRTVFQRVEDAGALVFQLEAKTRHVHQITEMIHSVAQRTNLLSLNASIEAARAGEAGRGFSVVADEIRKLAESASRSAEEISRLVNEIQVETAQVADEMRQSSQVIGEGRDDVNTIAHSLEQIQAAVSEAASRAEEIFQEADAQARDAERMVASVDEIARVAVENADSVRDVAESAQGQLEATAETAAAAQTMSELADEMRFSLRRFRIDGAPERDERAAS